MTFTTATRGRTDVGRDDNRVNYLTTMNGKLCQYPDLFCMIK